MLRSVLYCTFLQKCPSAPLFCLGLSQVLSYVMYMLLTLHFSVPQENIFVVFPRYAPNCSLIVSKSGWGLPADVTKLQNFMSRFSFNPLNAGLNPICHLRALLWAHHIIHISRVRVIISLTTWWNMVVWHEIIPTAVGHSDMTLLTDMRVDLLFFFWRWRRQLVI